MQIQWYTALVSYTLPGSTCNEVKKPRENWTVVQPCGYWTENTFPHAELAANGIVQCLPWRAPRSTILTCSKRGTITWCPCRPPANLETFNENISALTDSSKEIAGLLKKKRTKNMMTRNRQIQCEQFLKACVSPISYSWCVLQP